MVVVKNPRGRGGPPGFEREIVLDRAMAVFWASGFDGASIPMLTAGMGISAQSLYAAFGSKDALYREAVERYRTTIGAFADRALEEKDALSAIAILLRKSAILFSHDAERPGCMVTTAPASVVEDPLTRFGRELRADGIRKLTERLQRGITDGQLRPDIDCPAWGRYLSSVLQGMSVQARDGASAEALLSTAEIASDGLSGLRRG